VPVFEFGHDEYFVRPVDELLCNPSHGKNARACGSCFVLFRVAEEFLCGGAAIPVAGADEEEFRFTHCRTARQE
jgi:hypothetical protein